MLNLEASLKQINSRNHIVQISGLSIGFIIFVVGGIRCVLSSAERRDLFLQLDALQKDLSEYSKESCLFYELSDKCDSLAESLDSLTDDSFFADFDDISDEIEVTRRIQSVVYQLRKLSLQNDVILKDDSFGFDEYLSEVHLSQQQCDVGELIQELAIVYELSKLLIDSKIIALISINRNPQHSLDGMVYSTSASCISLNWEGYTDSLRNFLNELQSLNLPIQMVSMKVMRSTLSESDVIDSFFRNEQQTIKPQEWLDRQVAENQSDTLPLVGKVVSKFEVILTWSRNL